MTLVADRPGHGEPRPYQFPPFSHARLSNGIDVIAVHLPERELLAGALFEAIGAADERDAEGGLTVLMARAMTEGTRSHDAIALTEAGERLGASIHAEAGWDALSVGVDVPAARFEPALDLLAEVMSEPVFPESEVERLRDERLNDILQARADPRRRAEEGFVETIYADGSPYRRPSGGTKATVEHIDATACREMHERRFDPNRMTLVVGGDLEGLDVPELAERKLGSWAPSATREGPRMIPARPAANPYRVRVLDRPGSVQTEIRIGHVGLPRRIPDFHALSVMSAILGGLFNSRLNRVLREERGYTYGAGAGFDLRRAAGPFAARAAVNTEVTVPAIEVILAELDGMRERPTTRDELHAARDFLVGVFPLRFETPAAVVGAISSIVMHGLPDDELARYRGAIEAVDGEAVTAAARAHVRPEEASILLVGAADEFLPALEAAGLGAITVEREPADGSGGALDGGG
ncbi:MAG TPA: pitrilysin family protein [Candidatus Limnocylindrales bacterium]|nr:pitrilysin family protein [Candidatus Limnocylindrales bacterium]